MFDFFKKSSKKEPEAPISNIATLVKEGDNLLSDSLILLDESLSGNLYCAEDIVVEQNGVLSGNMTSKRCIVSGTINGDIVSTDQMDIKSTAVIRGNIKSAAINIEPGAVINGKVIIAEDNRAAARLMDRINNHSADEYLSAKLSAEKVDEEQIAAVNAAALTPVNKPLLAAGGEPEKVSVNYFQDKPVAIKHEEPVVIKQGETVAVKAAEEPQAPQAPIQQKPLVAPTPKVEDNPADEGANQRWW